MKEKVAVITGASVGIGRSVALKMASLGAKIVLIDINKEKLSSTEEEIKQITPHVLSFCCDVSDEKEVNNTFQHIRNLFGTVDILVNNAAIWRTWNTFLDVSIEEWKRFIDVNIMGTVYPTRAVLGDMIEKNYGRIVNVASVAGYYGNANMTHYSATKGAIISLTKALAKEVADKNILVNCISPGTVSPSKNSDVNYYEENTLNRMGRTGTDQENANLICFLAGDDATYIAGQNILIDGCRMSI
ncbi:MAG: SDR family oxidoreductase [Ruminococcaceae bacterium]|nr:SDR family oxidoreductase [Oscillospiraceae bacterium]